MRRPLVRRAAPSLVVATAALVASFALGAQAFWTPVAPQPAAAAQEISEVEGLAAATTSGLSASVVSGSVLGLPSPARRHADAPTAPSLDVVPSSAATRTSTAAPNASAPATRTTTTRATSSTATVWWKRYHGTNHVWMPTLGVSKPVYFYGCDRTTYPANVVYRWGCGGDNNVYLFGHNYGVFYPLYETWREGKLHKGLPVVYADAQGHTRLYRVTSWRVVSPTDSAWAIASQPSPSLTLQTCADNAGTNRLVVRLVSVAS